MSDSETSEGYPLLKDEAERLLRQVHPNLILNDQTPDVSAFQAQTAEGLLMSTRREAIGARAAFEDWTSEHASAGTWGIPVAAIYAADLKAFDDSADPGSPAGHASVDFRGLGKGDRRKRAGKLRDAALGTPLDLPKA